MVNRPAVAVTALAFEGAGVLAISISVGNVFSKMKKQRQLNQPVIDAVEWEHYILLPAMILFLTSMFMWMYLVLTPDEGNI